MSTEGLEPNQPPLLPEQRVGNAMREAREAAGISLRTMARNLGYHSHTTLSSYERGSVMPTDEAVTGYERLLGLSPGALTEVLESARIERHGDAWAKRRVHIRPEFAELGEVSKDPRPPRRGRWRPDRWFVIAVAMIAVATVALLVSLLVDQPGAAHTAGSVIGVRDGSDPTVTGCAADGVTLDSVKVYDPPEHLAGVLQLRSSARCGTSWPRFMPEPTLATSAKLILDLDVYRPADGGSAKFSVSYDGLAAYGNMLISAHQCVYAQVTLIQRGKPSLPPVRTGCQEAAG